MADGETWELAAERWERQAHRAEHQRDAAETERDQLREVLEQVATLPWPTARRIARQALEGTSDE